MRLTLKFIVALTLAIFVVLGVNAVVRIDREAKLFEDDIRQDSSLLGTTLAGAIERIWTTVGEDEALDLVEDADAKQNHIAMRWVWLKKVGQEAPLLTRSALARLAEGKVVIIRGTLQPGPSQSAYTYVPVSLPDGRAAALELRESLAPERRYRKKSIVHAIVTTSVLVLLCGLLAMALGILFVGRPVRRLVDQARRIGAGDLAPSEARGGGDEIDELAREMNAMCERLLEARMRLESETASRLATLEQLRHADRLTTVGKLAAGIAHEVGTPLNVITGHAQLVTEEYPPDSPAHENVVIIAEQAHRVTAIIRQLLDFARQRTLRKSSHDLRAIACQVAALLAPIAQKHKVSINVADSEDEIRTAVDAGQLQQVVTNLAVNGIQAMSAGGSLVLGTLRANKTPPEGGAEHRYAAIYVEDSGAGIAKEDLPRIFEPFFTTKEVGDGTGLGLSVAYGIVKEHGGWIDVQSTPHKSTRFTVYLAAEENHE